MPERRKRAVEHLEKVIAEVTETQSTSQSLELASSQLLDNDEVTRISAAILANKKIRSVEIRFSLLPLAADALLHALARPQSHVQVIRLSPWNILHHSQRPLIEREEEYPATIAAYNAEQARDQQAYGEFLNRNAQGLAFKIQPANAAQPIIFTLPPMPTDFIQTKIKPFLISPAPRKLYKM